MKKLKLLFPVLLSLLLISCGGEASTTNEQEQPKNQKISGTITGAEGEKVRLMVIENGQQVFIDSTVIVDGYYELQTNTNQLREYVVFVSTDIPAILFLDESSSEVELSGAVPGFGENYSVKGSKHSEDVRDYMKFITQFTQTEQALYNEYNTIDPANTKRKDQIMKSLDSISVIQREYAVENIMKDTTSPVSWMLLNELMPASGIANMDTNDLVYYQRVANGMKSKYSYSEYPGYILTNLVNIRTQLAQLNAPPSAAAEINQPDPDGKMISLSSLKGKVVLIDFWASWCVPCRQANPEVVTLYNKYKSKGFTVYSVSLDEDKEAWKKAIKDDNLSWPYHVSDLKGWSSEPAALYGVGAIPATFLLNKNGEIVGRDLHGSELEQKLLELLEE